MTFLTDRANTPNPLHQEDTGSFEGRRSGMTLQDGRHIEWQEFGAEDGFPILYFHGTPGSSVEGGVFEDAALARSVRIIAVDRPGVGRSDFLLDRQVIDWPGDVRQITDHLNLVKFSIVGWSGGGPYALVCGPKLRKHLYRIGLVAPQTERAVLNNDLERWASRIWMPALKALTRVPRVGESILELSFRLSDKHRQKRPDQRIYRRVFARSHRHAQEVSSRGVVHDNAALLTDWGTTVTEVARELDVLSPPLPITIWQGGHDTSVDIDGTRDLAKSLPDCELIFDPDATHLGILLDQADAILDAMTPRATK